jgi:hypothetical protein
LNIDIEEAPLPGSTPLVNLFSLSMLLFHVEASHRIFLLPSFQLCPIDPGIANGQEMEQLKKIDGVFIAF